MNKKHLILPVVACLMLAGCTMGSKANKKKKKSSVEVSSKVDSTSQGGTSISPTSSPTSVAPTSSPTSAAPTSSPTSAAPTSSPTSAAPTSSPTSATTSTSSGTSVTPSTSSTPVPPVGSWTQVTSSPSAGNNYLIGCNHGATDSFLDGTMKNIYYPNCEATTETAIRFTVAKSGDGFTIQATSGDVSGQYLVFYKDGTHISAKYDTEAYVFSWITEEGGATANSFGGVFNDGQHGDQSYVLAQQNNTTTLSPYYYGKWTTFPIGRLYQQV